LSLYRKRAKEGLWRGGANVPTGYKYIEDNGGLIIDNYEAMQIKEIFKLYNEGKGYHKIAELLNKKGYKKGNGFMWQLNAVKRVLTNPIYKGYIEYNNEVYIGLHQPIVSKDLFDKTQELIKKRSSNSRPKSKYLLGGMLWCGYCGARMKATWITRYKKGPKHYYYICYSASGSPSYMVKDLSCPGKHITMEKIEEFVIGGLNKIKLDRNRIAMEYSLDLNDQMPNIDTDILNSHVDNIDKQISKLLLLYQYSNISPEEISERIYSLQRNRLELLNTIENNQHQNNPHISLDEILKYIDNINLIWEEATFDEKRIILKSFVNKIEVKNDHIHIEWNSRNY